MSGKSCSSDRKKLAEIQKVMDLPWGDSASMLSELSRVDPDWKETLKKGRESFREKKPGRPEKTSKEATETVLFQSIVTVEPLVAEGTTDEQEPLPKNRCLPKHSYNEIKGGIQETVIGAGKITKTKGMDGEDADLADAIRKEDCPHRNHACLNKALKNRWSNFCCVNCPEFHDEKWLSLVSK